MLAKQVVTRRSCQWEAPCKCDKCRRGRARPDYITTYAYACINNVEPPDRRPVKLRAYVGRESPVDCSAEHENRFWPLGGPWQNGFPVTISCSMKATRTLVDIRKLSERIYTVETVSGKPKLTRAKFCGPCRAKGFPQTSKLHLDDVSVTNFHLMSLFFCNVQ